MILKEQFHLITDFFEREKMEYAVAGAFALYAYGFVRATRDIDFITRIEYQEKLVTHLEARGFETLHRSGGYSNHLNQTEGVRIDLIYVEGETAAEIFRSIQRERVVGDLTLPVVSPQHLIALKLFAVKNEPGRKHKELADIREIFRRTRLDKNEALIYFKRYGMENEFKDISDE